MNKITLTNKMTNEAKSSLEFINDNLSQYVLTYIHHLESEIKKLEADNDCINNRITNTRNYLMELQLNRPLSDYINNIFDRLGYQENGLIK